MMVCAATAMAMLTFTPVTRSGAAPKNPEAAPGGRTPEGAGRKQQQFRISSMPLTLINSVATLTDDQKTKITAILDKLKSDKAAIVTPGAKPTPEDRKKASDLEEAASQQITSILTADQVSAITNFMPVLQDLAMSRAVNQRSLETQTLTAEQIGKLESASKDLDDKRKLLEEETKSKQQAMMASYKDTATGILGAAK